MTNQTSKPTYIQRNALLQRLGYSSYAHYLASELWAEIRYIVLERDMHKCGLCKTVANTVHHLNYSEATLTGEMFNGLITICRMCHEEVEFNKKGEKRTLAQSVAAYRRRVKFWLYQNKKTRESKKPRKQKKVMTRCVVCKRNWAKSKCTECRPCKKAAKKAPKKPPKARPAL